MTNFIIEQISVSTADDEVNYFTGQPEFPWGPNPNTILPPGTYRVIEGQLYRIIGGVPIARSIVTCASQGPKIEEKKNG